MGGRFWYTDGNGKRKRTKAGIAHDYKQFQSSTKAKKERAARNTARRRALKAGKVHKGDNLDIDHIKGVSAGNGSSNLRVMSAHANRGRRQKSRKRGARHSSWKE